MPLNDRLEPLKGRQVVGSGVDERHHHERHASLRGGIENGRADILHKLEESGGSEIKDRARDIDSGVVVEQPPRDALKKGSCRSELSGGGRSVYEDQIHTVTIAVAATLVMSIHPRCGEGNAGASPHTAALLAGL